MSTKINWWRKYETLWTKIINLLNTENLVGARFAIHHVSQVNVKRTVLIISLGTRDNIFLII